MDKNIFWHKNLIDKKAREELNGHKGIVVWLTGLSGSGKSTLAIALEERLFDEKIKSFILDGDNIRHGLNSDLGFSDSDRNENIRRVAEVAKLFLDAGTVVIVSFISPFKKERLFARNLINTREFFEVYVKCSLEECKKRDPKKLYEKAISGKIPEFTGISSPYEEPENPELTLITDKTTLEDCVLILMKKIKERILL